MSIVQSGIRNRQVRIAPSESRLHRLSQGASKPLVKFANGIVRACIEHCCRHPETARRTLNGRLYIECLQCGHQSKGIEI